MKYQKLYILAVSTMAITASLPFLLSTQINYLGIILTALSIGIFFISERTGDFFEIFSNTFMIIIFFLSFICLITPYCCLLLLTFCILFIRNKDFFGVILFACLLTLGFGLKRIPSIPIASAFLLSMTMASYLRVARHINREVLAINIFVTFLSIITGCFTAFMSTVNISFLNLSFANNTEAKKPGVFAFLLALMLAGILSYIFSKFVHFKTSAKSKKEVQGLTGYMLKDEEIPVEKRRRYFSGEASNTKVVHGYLKWRKQLVKLGMLFRKDQTAEEGEQYLLSKMVHKLDQPPREELSRITNIFNSARYNPEPVGSKELEEFTSLTEKVISILKGPARK